MQSKILEWRKFAAEASLDLKPQFRFILDEHGFTDVDAEDILFRACNRYAGYLKLVHHKTQRYFTEMWALHGVANQFSIKDAKWLLSILTPRTKSGKDNLDLENMQTILYWIGLRYDFYLGQQFYS